MYSLVLPVLILCVIVILTPFIAFWTGPGGGSGDSGLMDSSSFSQGHHRRQAKKGVRAAAAGDGGATTASRDHTPCQQSGTGTGDGTGSGDGTHSASGYVSILKDNSDKVRYPKSVYCASTQFWLWWILWLQEATERTAAGQVQASCSHRGTFTGAQQRLVKNTEIRCYWIQKMFLPWGMEKRMIERYKDSKRSELRSVKNRWRQRQYSREQHRTKKHLKAWRQVRGDPSSSSFKNYSFCHQL